MIKKMVMDEDRLREVLGLAQIGLPESEFSEVLGRVNEVLRMCDEMQELDHDSVKPFEWDVRKTPPRRADVSGRWNERDAFLAQAPTTDGDFFHVPRIIALEEDGGADK